MMFIRCVELFMLQVRTETAGGFEACHGQSGLPDLLELANERDDQGRSGQRYDRSLLRAARTGLFIVVGGAGFAIMD